MPKIAQKQIKSLNMRRKCVKHFVSYFFHDQAPDVITFLVLGLCGFDFCFCRYKTIGQMPTTQQLRYRGGIVE